MLTEQLAFSHWPRMNPYTDTISSIVIVIQVCVLFNLNLLFIEIPSCLYWMVIF